MIDDLPTAQAKALGAPTRQAIVAYLAAADGPVAVAELTDHLGLNHNAVRKHLAQLVGARLVVEASEQRSVPGRPKLLYRLHPDAPAAVEHRYRRLAVMLATALATGEDPAEIGRRSAAAPAPSPGRDPIEALAARFEADGFEPVVRRRRGRTELVLERCPFADAASANPTAVCRLHLGLAEGSADAIGDVTVEGLVPKDPHRAGCIVSVRAT